MPELYYGHVEQVHGPIDPGYGRPERPPIAVPPIALPPLPPGIALPPIYIPPSGQLPVLPHPPVAVPPIVIPEPPDVELPGPPAVIWPPLPPGTGIAGKALALIWIVGVGYRWLVVGGTDIWPPPPPTAQPK